MLARTAGRADSLFRGAALHARRALVLVCAGGAMASLLLTATKRVGGGERLSVSAFRLVMSSRLTTLDEKLDYHFTAT